MTERMSEERLDEIFDCAHEGAYSEGWTEKDCVELALETTRARAREAQLLTILRKLLGIHIKAAKLLAETAQEPEVWHD